MGFTRSFTQEGPATLVRLRRDGRRLSHADFARALQEPAGADALTRLIADSPHPALFWECAPSSRERQDEPLEFALLDSPRLARAEPDRWSFSQQLAGVRHVATFDNLSGRSVLVAPAQVVEPGNYTHLACFLRGAPQHQTRSLWAAVGAALQRRWRSDPSTVWLSTSGLGVSWLHVRLDPLPKYYTHRPYRDPSWRPS